MPLSFPVKVVVIQKQTSSLIGMKDITVYTSSHLFSVDINRYNQQKKERSLVKDTFCVL